MGLQLGGDEAGAAFQLIPVIAVLAAWVQLGEVPLLNEGLGMLMLALALAMIAVLGMRRHEPVEAATGQD
jgi:drug/metabolite transporter (DMT)-like permease